MHYTKNSAKSVYFRKKKLYNMVDNECGGSGGPERIRKEAAYERLQQ